MQVALAVADPHIKHVVDADRNEVGFDFASSRPGNIGLAAARWPVQQNSTAGLFSVRSKHFRMRYRIDNLDTNESGGETSWRSTLEESSA